MRIFEGIERNAERSKDKICMVHGDKLITYAELVDKIQSISKRLCSKWNVGEKIFISHEDPIMQILYFLSCSKAGLAAVLVEGDFNSEKIKVIIEKVNPSAIMDENFVLPGKEGELPSVSDEDIFLGALSSGTSGEQKLIWRDHKSWTSAFQSQSDVFSIDGNDTVFLSGSLVYTANLNSALHILNEGGCVVFSQGSYPKTWIKEMEQNNVTSVFMVPSNYRILIKNMKGPINNIKSAVSAGEKLEIETAAEMKRLFPHAKICEYYGASELGHVSFIQREEILEGDSIGKAFPGVEFWIEDGMVWVKSPYLAPHYRPKATAGDLGRIDSDGKLYILGRKHDIINKGGIKIIPQQVEKVLQEHPGIARAVVLGINNPIKGEQVAAVIVKKEKDLTYENILSFCRKKLDIHSCPQRIKFIDAFPENENLKINRKKLARYFE